MKLDAQKRCSWGGAASADGWSARDEREWDARRFRLNDAPVGVVGDTIGQHLLCRVKIPLVGCTEQLLMHKDRVEAHTKCRH